MPIARLIVAGACAATMHALAAAPAPAQQPDPARIDAIFAEYDRDGSPGCVLGVVHDGALVYERGYGYANLDYAVPNAPHMVYYVGSVSKQFTAAAIALLAQEGRISLDDDVRRYIPELPDYGRTMTVRHLVHHTAGLRDIYTLMSLAGLLMEDVFTDDEALALIARQRELNFLPGDEYLYSNSGYWLMGLIVKRVTGQSLREYADEKLFRPLGMGDTRFHDQPHVPLRNRAYSYGAAGDGTFRITYLQNFDKVGAGGLYTTLADLAKWDANFYEPAVGGPAFLEVMHTRGVLTSGDTLSYAFGNTLQQRRGVDIVRHSGALMGFRADLVRYPSERLSVITLCNLGSIEPAGLADRVADLYLADRLAPEPPPAAARPVATAAPRPDAAPVLALTAAALQEFAGRYHSAELDVTYTIDVAGDGLALRRRVGGPLPLRPIDRDRFAGGGFIFRYLRDGAGSVSGFEVDAGRVRNIRFGRQ